MRTYKAAAISRSEIQRIIHSYDEWYQHARFGFMLATHGKSAKLIEKTATECRFWARKLLRRKTKEEVLADSLPDLGGKRVIDIGCNSGLKSIEASCKGAEFVLGVERNATALRQANDLTKIARGLGRPLGSIDFRRVDDINNHLDLLDDMDVLLACCVLYHLGPLDNFQRRISGSKINTFILQGNTGRRRKINEEMRKGGWGNVLCDVPGMTDFCTRNGFKIERITYPEHQYPVVIAKRTAG